jgi:hypothetical protein
MASGTWTRRWCCSTWTVFSIPCDAPRLPRAAPDGVVYRLLLNPRHGPLLTGLAERTGAEIVWASHWTGAAND